LFHHALERDNDGVFWVATKIEPTQIKNVNKKLFNDDAIAAVDDDGKILMNRSV
jgi:hypothetical protein